MINYSSSGNGSAPHMSMALLVSMTGINIVHIPYKGGTPQVTALMSGVSQSLAGQALDPWTSSPEEFDARLKTDFEKYAKLIKLTSAKIE